MSLDISEKQALSKPVRNGVNALGGYIAVARMLGVKPGWLEKALCPTDPTHKLDLFDLVALLDRFSDEDFDAVLEMILARRGRLPPMARPKLMSNQEILQTMAEFYSRAGVMSGVIRRAHEPDSERGILVSPREAKEIARVVTPVAVPLFEIKGAADAIAQQ